MKIIRSLALVTAGALLAAPCFAQLDRGAITGTVTDSSNAVVPGAKIAIRNLATNVKYQSATTGAGDYNAVNLPSGSYEVTFEATGLKTLVRSNIVVVVSETVRVDASLPVGTSKDTVTVTSEASPLQTDSPVVGVVLQNRVVN